ncbi:hypothetical protein [Stenotrophomonas phage BUCTxx99]|nr:hypothetical protein [Stenotrophomonas phage BUCTxx99]
MAKTVKTKNRTLGTINGWGIATTVNGELELVASAEGRMEIRAVKRKDYPGKDYKVVQISAKLTHYLK